MGDRNIAHTQEVPSLYLQGKHHAILDDAGRCGALRTDCAVHLALF